MTITTLPAVSHSAARSREASSLVRGILARGLDLVVTWLQRDRDRRTLQALDDRLLRDMGISRADVEHEVAKPFWRS